MTFGQKSQWRMLLEAGSTCRRLPLCSSEVMYMIPKHLYPWDTRDILLRTHLVHHAAMLRRSPVPYSVPVPYPGLPGLSACPGTTTSQPALKDHHITSILCFEDHGTSADNPYTTCHCPRAKAALKRSTKDDRHSNNTAPLSFL